MSHISLDTFLGIDCGTQGTKALLIDTNDIALGQGYAPHQLVERSTGAREQDPAWWVAALRAAVMQALAQADQRYPSHRSLRPAAWSRRSR